MAAFREEDFKVTPPEDVGRVLLLRVLKTPLALPSPFGPLAPDAWFCRWFELTPPRGARLHFPCYQWLEDEGSLALREGTAKISWEDHHPTLQQQRWEELQAKRKTYGWKTYIPGWPRCLNEETVKNLDLNIKYSLAKSINLYLRGGSILADLKLKGLLHHKGLWKSLEEIKIVFNFRKTPAVEYVFEHWQEDAFFAYQFLNGLNPVLIRRCHHLPKNFPVTNAMVAPVLGPGTSLQAELERGSLFLVDHGILSGIHTKVINGRSQFSAAPVTLLYQRPGCGPLLPIAIQLSQTPGPDSPIFLPSDDKWDWLLAKTWVRNAEFSVHEALTHLLQVHLVTEVFALATLRQLPHCHPLFKLLIPHTRYTLHINTLARELLIAPGKVVDRSTGLGIEGFSELIQRNMKQLNYSVLCLPEDIRARGVEDIPGYYYRDDGMQIWGAVESFVSEMIGIYYPSDESVRNDSELQAWVWEIFSEGFLGRESSGVPSSLGTREALIQYVTMVIFTSSAKHSSVGAGQFDFSAWMPNLPSTMQLPPPTSKGQASPEGFIATLPPVNTTCDIIIALWVLSKDPGDRRPLGTYPDEHFTEEAPRRSIASFQSRLAQISRDIRERNQGLALPYTYLDPPLIENSVSI
ncbi:polyunsaturated fatty acid lipoxygenase ALOX15B isoform X2 [Hippopotamus amphibius kiboko]|uniref:polyunsaturated fatty acid lipoxygenase ALOX15B isoform X2 n=1 Tax=Hippopotamus amphibius kiboko TaxID=575201 RepID=UPI002593D73D|nr:polyunsaturated fatty acid lipoxygenase ALOX15B isoform X2 [Hippopotamus amphibius kiboko]